MKIAVRNIKSFIISIWRGYMSHFPKNALCEVRIRPVVKIGSFFEILDLVLPLT